MRKKYRRENLFYNILSKGSSLADYVLKNRKFFLAAIIAGLLCLFLIREYKKYFFILLLTGIGAASMLYQRYFRYSHYLGLELCMMATVLSGLAYGHAAGAVTGFFSITFAFILSGNFKHSSFISIMTLPLIGAIVPFFGNLPLLYLGLLMTLLYDMIILPMYYMLGSRIISSALFFISHMLINAWVFSTLAPFLYNIMT